MQATVLSVVSHTQFPTRISIFASFVTCVLLLAFFWLASYNAESSQQGYRIQQLGNLLPFPSTILYAYPYPWLTLDRTPTCSLTSVCAYPYPSLTVTHTLTVTVAHFKVFQLPNLVWALTLKPHFPCESCSCVCGLDLVSAPLCPLLCPLPGLSRTFQ